MGTAYAARLRHRKWGICELVRIEATDWIVRVKSTGVHFRVPPENRSHFEVVTDVPTATREPVAIQTAGFSKSAEARNARRVIESLRVGLPSLDGSTRQLSVGFGETERLMNGFLDDINIGGGGALLLKGQYGQGKTFALSVLEGIAHASGFMTGRTEIDATENRLNKPHHIYHDLLRNLKFPVPRETGAVTLARKVCDLLSRVRKGKSHHRMQWLEEHLGCFPLSWILSDAHLPYKPALLGLLECDPNFPVPLASVRPKILSTLGF